jgi:hypothetical protein
MNKVQEFKIPVSSSLRSVLGVVPMVGTILAAGIVVKAAVGLIHFTLPLIF